MQRISREACNIKIAQIISQRGTCDRLQVGAVITRNNTIISTGYNGPAKGEEHCNPFMCNTTEPCKRAIHAEENAISKIGWIYDLFDWQDCDYILYCTHQPCLSCAKLISGVPISMVYFLEPYRDISGLEYLITKGIPFQRIDLNGKNLSL